MKITRVWAMPNKHTFQIKPIGDLVHRLVYWSKKSIDPFAGFHSPADVTNDLNPKAPTQHHLDALEFLRGQPTGGFDFGINDPPYSYRQASECYKKYGRERLTAEVTNNGYWSKVKNELARVIQADGYVVCLGWDSSGLGKNRGFEIEQIMLVCHGAGHNDTILTLERKVQTSLIIEGG